MSDTHAGESAELYALGLLSEAECRVLQAHAASCLECRRLIGEAEATVLALERQTAVSSAPLGSGLRFQRRAVRMPQWAAVAAAFVLGVLPGAWLASQHAALSSQHETAAVAMVRDHFNHAQFAPAFANAPHAKLIYARNRSWMYVIVEGAHRYEVVAVRREVPTSIGFTNPGSASSELFVPKAPAADSILLREGGTTVERVKLP